MSKLCRFCECPVSEGGVLLSEVDRDALSSWWSKCLHAELDAETLRDAWSCRQCVADARFWHENCDGELEADLNWWPSDDIFYKYYKAHQLKSLTVNVKKLSESDFEDLEVKVEKICCEFCEKTFFIPTNLDLHVQRKHQSASEDQLFNCVLCSKLIGSKGKYTRHLKQFHENKIIKCNYEKCYAVFSTEKSLASHLKKIHILIEGKKPLECKLCNKWLKQKRTLKSHMNWHAKRVEAETQKTFECLFCPERFASGIILNQHTKEEHKSEAIQCKNKRCKNLYYKTKEQMEQHFESAHRNKCKFCRSTFDFPCHLLRHLKEVHLEKQCKFSKCVFYTDSKEELEKHVKEKHNFSKKIFDCIYCGKKYAIKFRMNEHIRKKHPQISISCDYERCAHFFNDLVDLEKHKKEAHQRKEKHKQSVECLYCQQNMWDRMAYIGHIRRNHSEEAIRCKYKQCFTFFKSEIDHQKHNEEKHIGKYKCALCDYNTAVKQNIQYHLQQRHLPKDKKCPHCPKYFGSLRTMRSHILDCHEHSNLKKCPHCLQMRTDLNYHVVTANCPVCFQPFPCRKLLFDHKLKCKITHECSECGKTFKIKYYLKQHINLRHKSGKKWKGFECKFCNQFFLDSKSLRSHQKSEHSHLMKFNCNLCEEAYFTKISLISHIAKKHDKQRTLPEAS